ncbi:hypothetical protein O181_048020 [Austropuccinia psidii MF-1]|uniref:RRM domain-containing protein n=1 Tax=Austropuccinia psidii MF-1 TaxID=1389203 RepID=A0A9Q3DR81_9BASI|nr:hypothetical protein [Austropuccinia psidii MF-1]
MAPKNKKAQKVNLTDFLADTSTGRSWADEMDELPTAPAPRDPNEPSQSSLGGSHLTHHDGNRYGDRSGNYKSRDQNGFDSYSRPEIPIPDNPPYNAFIGNLSWEVSSDQLKEFLGESHITSIRMITDNVTGKPKGYGYIEFDERDALVEAIKKSGQELGSRPIRISVAEPPKEDRTGGAWRREGPLPSFDERRSRHSSNHYERSSMDEVDRGERMGFGSKFVPSSASPTHSTRRTQSGRGYSRNDPSQINESDPIDRGERMGFGSKFVASAEEPRKDREPPQLGSNFVPSHTTPIGSDDGITGVGASKKTTFSDRKSNEATPTIADSVSSWRNARPVSSTERESSNPASAIAPPRRRKLELSARTVGSSDGTLTPPQSIPTNKPSPFGNAKPVDSAERERQIQERLDREREDLAGANSPKKTAQVVEPASEDPVPSEPAPAPKAPKFNPFGEAKPVNTLQKEIEIEQKLEKDKKLLEEKLKREGEEAKLSTKPTSPLVVTKDSTHPEIVASSSTTRTKTNPSSSTSTTQQQQIKASNPNSRWKPHSAANTAQKSTSNGTLKSTPDAIQALTSPTDSATSLKSPNLSSFRKEGVSFAALAKAAVANSKPNQAISNASKSARNEHVKQASQPKTILKRVEGLEIQKE